jgi:hypothetical protein
MRDFGTKIDNSAPAPSGVLTAEEDNVRFREDENLVSTSGVSLDPATGPDTDLKMKAQAVARYAAGGAVVYNDTGSADNYVLSSPSGVNGFVMPKIYFEGMEIEFKPSNSCTGASTVNANGLGGKPLRRTNGDPTETNDIIAGVPCAARYSPSHDAFLISPWALKEAAEVSGTTGSYLNLWQYPEVKTNNGLLSLSSPTSGNLQVSTGGRIIHRGWREYLTDDYALAQRQFTTLANRTYHLRWSPANGFQLRDLSNSSYNPSSLPETHTYFDSTYDNMLAARIVTNGSNSLSVTNLVNKAELKLRAEDLENATAPFNEGANWAIHKIVTFPINWARTPTPTVTGYVGHDGAATMGPYGNRPRIDSHDRYHITGSARSTYTSSNKGNLYGAVYVLAFA